jgi:hypothetical protein
MWLSGQMVCSSWFLVSTDRKGVKSRAREQVLGYYDAPRSSGYAIFRAWFDGAEIRKDPVCAHLATEGGDQKTVWIGPDVHFIASAYKKGKEFNWVMTHRVCSLWDIIAPNPSYSSDLMP